MAKSVYVERAGEILDFPDTATPQQIQTYIDRKYGAPVAPVAPPPKEEGIGALEAGLYGTRSRVQTAVGRTAQAVGLEGYSQYLLNEARANQERAAKYKPEVADISQIGGVGDVASFAGSTIGQSLPETAIGVGGAYAGAAAGAALGSAFFGVGAIPGSIIGGIIGGALASLPSFVGGNLQRQAQEQGIPLEETDLSSASVGAIAQAPLDAAFDTLIARKLPGGGAALDVVKNGFLREVARTAAQGAVTESLTEPAQQAIELAQANPAKLREFSPEVQMEILNAAAAGALAGGVIGGAAGGFESTIGRKISERPYRQLSEDLAKEQLINSQAMRQGQISLGAEDLRNFNVEGNVEVVQEEVDGLPRFVIKTEAGNSVGQFLDPSEAEEAVEIYKQRTGAKVTVRKPEDLPSVFPVKIGGEEFNSTDEIIAARDGLVSKSEGLASYMSRPEILKREATRQNVSEALVKKAVDKEVADLNGKISKLNEFISKAKPTPTPLEPGGLRESVLQREAVTEAPKAVTQPKGLSVIPYDTISWDDAQKKAIRSSGTNDIIDYGGRKIVVKDVNGVSVPFYLSTGSGGKKDVPAGKWYPFFGVGPTDGWINKTGGSEMASYYGSPELEAAALELDSTIGDIRSDTSIPKVSPSGAHIEFINKGLDPADNQSADTINKVRASIDRVKSLVSSGAAVQTEAVAGEAPIGAVATEVATEETAAIEEPKEAEPYSAGSVKEARPVRRTLAQAEAEGPIVRDYTPETKQRYQDIYTALKSRLSGRVPKDVDVKLEELISADKNVLIRGQARAEKTPNGIKSIVDLSTGVLRPDMTVEQAVKELAETLDHEIIHVLRDQGVLRPAEWAILSKAVTSTKVPGKAYTYLDKAQAVYTPAGQPIAPIYANPDAVVEEAVAEMYKDWVKNQTAPVQTRGLFNRITEFFRSIFRVLKSSRYEEIFKGIDTGEVGAREGVGREATTRFSASPARAEDEDDGAFSAQVAFDQAGDYGGVDNAIDSYRQNLMDTIWEKYSDKQERDAAWRVAEAAFDREVARLRGRGTRFSAAPLPPYVEAKNRTLFRPEPKVPFHKQMFDFFLGHPTAPKTIRTIYGDIELSAIDRFLLSARVGAVDNTAYVEHLEKLLNERDTGNFQRRDADFSATAALAWNRRSSQLAASVIMMGKPEIKFARPGDIQSATIAAENDPDSLLNVFRIMLEPGPIDSVTGEAKDKREVFRSYATAMRAIGLKAAGLPVPRELDDTYINTTIPFTQQNYPEVVEAYRMYQRFNKNLLTAARDAGVITTASLANLTRKMDYYGFYREVYQEELTPNIPSKTAGEFDLREYKGSQYGNLIDDPMFVIVQNTQFWMSAISRNLAATKTFELAKNMGEARLLGAAEKPDPARGEFSDVMFFRKDGVTKRFAVSDPLLVSALGSDDRADIGAAMKVLGYPTKIIRESVTRDPAFMITNLIRDTLSSWITSGEDFTPFIGTAKGFAKALKGTASYEALMGRGVVGSHDLAMQGPGELAATLRRRLNPPNIHSITSVKGATDVLGTLWDRLGVWSEASDAATRIAVYESAKAQGMSEAEATFRAIQILDFSRRGGSLVLNMLTKLIPFLNARIQGLDVLYQAGMAGQRYLRGQSRGEKDANLGKKFLVRGTILAAISLALEMMNEDDEDYKDLPDYLKKSNLLIPLKGFGLDGQFLAIAKPFEAGLIFSTMPQQFYKTMAGDVSTRDNVGFFVESFASTLGVNPIPQILMPALEVIVNHDFYTGLPLISEGKARLSPELQYDSRTSTLARMLGDIPISYNFTTGKFEGVSPIIIDQLIGGYGGPIGTMIAQGVGYGLEMAEQGPERLPRDLTAHPIIRRFFVDAESRSPKTVAQAYELFRIVDEANRSFSRLRQTGDAEAAMRYLEENKDALTYKKYVFKLVDRLNKLSAYERQIERDKGMTDDEKREAVNKIREVRKNLTSKIGEINKALGR